MYPQSVLSTSIKGREPLPTDVSPHLVAHWPCDEGAGGILNDKSGNNLHLKHGGTPGGGLWSESGRVTLDGVGDYFAAPLCNGSKHSLLRPQYSGHSYTASTISANIVGGVHSYSDSANGFGALNVGVGDYVEFTGFVNSGINAIRRIIEYSPGYIRFQAFDDEGTYLPVSEAAGAVVTVRKILPPSIILSAFVKTTDVDAFLLWLRDTAGATPQGTGLSINATGQHTHTLASYAGSQIRVCSTACNDGAEHHIAVVLDAYSPRRCMFFVDGSYVNTVDGYQHSWRCANLANITALKAILGASYFNGTPAQFYAGTIRNVQVYCQYKKGVWPTSGVVPEVSSAWVAKLATGAVLTRADMP